MAESVSHQLVFWRPGFNSRAIRVEKVSLVCNPAYRVYPHLGVLEKASYKNEVFATSLCGKSQNAPLKTFLFC
jgi:hypothetical protein